MSCGGAFLRMVTPLRGSMTGARISVRSCGAARLLEMEERRVIEKMINREVIGDMIAFVEETS